MILGELWDHFGFRRSSIFLPFGNDPETRFYWKSKNEIRFRPLQAGHFLSQILTNANFSRSLRLRPVWQLLGTWDAVLNFWVPFWGGRKFLIVLWYEGFSRQLLLFRLVLLATEIEHPLRSYRCPRPRTCR